MSVQEIAPASLTAMQRWFNEQLMVAWINRDLLNRAQHDVRKSVVLYDADYDFLYAVESVPDEATMQRLYEDAGVRFYSKGVV